MKKILLALGIIGMVGFTSCQSCSRNLGGTTNINLQEGEKFINVTWKDSSIWVLTQDKSNPQKFTFKEYSNLGVLQGRVVINEQ